MYCMRYLRVSTEDVILPSVYLYISPFVGDYSAFQGLDTKWGVLARTGKVVVPPKYEKVELLPRGRVKLSYAIGSDQVKYLKDIIQA